MTDYSMSMFRSKDDMFAAMQADISTMLVALEKIIMRSLPHPDDTDEDRKRNLYHVESLARNALKGGKP